MVKVALSLMGILIAVSVTTVSQRHAAIKAVFGPLDDAVVAAGLIDDHTLHAWGAALGVSGERPGHATNCLTFCGND